MRVPVLLLASLLALAGCVGPVATPTVGSPPAAPDPNTIPWALTRCTYVVGWSNADPEKVQARLPEGMTVTTGRMFGVPIPFAAVGTETFECESGSGLEETVSPMVYGSIWLVVVPPEDQVVEGVDLYMYKEAILVPDAARLAWLGARGLPVFGGGVTTDGGALPGGARTTLSLDGFGDFTLTLGAAQQGTPGEGGEFIELTPATGGLAAWRAKFAWDDGDVRSGRGTIDWPEGSWVADAVGSRHAPAQFHAGTWSFNGTLTLPAPAAP